MQDDMLYVSRHYEPCNFRKIGSNAHELQARGSTIDATQPHCRSRVQLAAICRLEKVHLRSSPHESMQMCSTVSIADASRRGNSLDWDLGHLFVARLGSGINLLPLGAESGHHYRLLEGIACNVQRTENLRE